ncbi:hypothetical protein EDC96DRAFT_310161 [Choanephora cucurbitarum]|nr:hypothetical protein EDC96DRAFT_310161 [Choanephora cucurbitarum]
MPSRNLLIPAYIDPITCLSLPLAAVISPSSPTTSSHHTTSTATPFHTPNLQPLFCYDLFYFDTLTLQLEFRQPSFTHSTYPTFTRQAIRSVRTGMISLLPFLQHNRMPAPRIAQTLTSFYYQLYKPSTYVSSSPFFSRSYKFLTRSRNIFPPTVLSPSNWKTYWSLAIPLQARTVWYRLLHKKIPCRSLLHQLIPSSFPSPLCHVCSTSEETIDHFLFLCPAKASVWMTILTTYIHPFIRFVPSDIPRLLLCIYRFFPVTRIRDPSLPLFSLSQEQIFACTLLGIW